MPSRFGRAYPIKINQSKRETVSLAVKVTPPVSLPANASLSEWLGPVRDQGSLGSCSSHAWTGLREVLYNKYYSLEKDKNVKVGALNLSPLYHYYKERIEERTYPADSGAQLQTGATIFERYGCCLESVDAYNTDKFNTPPTTAQEEAAQTYQVSGTLIEIRNLTELKVAISSGLPVVLGIVVYSSFESDYTARTGDMLLPNPQEEEMMGGHAVLAWGYDDNTQKITIRNSWGLGWGDHGNFHMGYKIFETPNMIIDAYTLHPSYLDQSTKPLKVSKTKQETKPE